MMQTMPIVGADALLDAAPSAATQPTQAQIARFNDQLGGPAAESAMGTYDAPLPVGSGQSTFKPMMDLASEANDRLRSALYSQQPRVDLPPDLAALSELLTATENMSAAHAQFSIMSEAMRSTNRSVQTLYQQQG